MCQAFAMHLLCHLTPLLPSSSPALPLPYPPPLPQGIGDEPDVESSSATLMETEEGFQPVFFHPRRLRNLVKVKHLYGALKGISSR